MMNKCSVCFIEIPVEGSEVKQTSGYFDQLIQYRYKDFSLFDGQVARCVQFQQKGITDCGNAVGSISGSVQSVHFLLVWMMSV